jgi:hypothetical protein
MWQTCVECAEVSGCAAPFTQEKTVRVWEVATAAANSFHAVQNMRSAIVWKGQTRKGEGEKTARWLNGCGAVCYSRWWPPEIPHALSAPRWRDDGSQARCLPQDGDGHGRLEVVHRGSVHGRACSGRCRVDGVHLRGGGTVAVVLVMLLL